MNYLGKRLRELRVAKGVPQDEVANLLNVKRQTYSAYERGVSIPDALTLKVLADYFEVTTDYLLEVPEEEVLEIENAAPLEEVPRRGAELLIKHNVVKPDGTLDQERFDRLDTLLSLIEELRNDNQ